MNRYLTTTRTIAVMAFAAATLLSVGGTASATSSKQSPVSGDDRATAHEGNATTRDCPTLFPGSQAVDTADLTTETDGSGTYLDITAVADGTEVVGVIVKGGPAYNQYDAGSLGALPWLDLHSPLVPSGKPAQISHWFACGVPASPTTTTTPPATTTDTEPTTTPGETTPGETTPGETTPGETTPGETTPASTEVSPAADDEELAETGFASSWLVGLGAALLLGGGALLFLMRTRGARR